MLAERVIEAFDQEGQSIQAINVDEKLGKAT